MESVKKLYPCTFTSFTFVFLAWPSINHSSKAFLYVTVVFGMFISSYFTLVIRRMCRSQCPRGLRRRSSVVRLLRLWVRIAPGAWMFVCCECCVLSDRGLCDGLITRLKESYRLWRFVVCDQETSKTKRLKPATGLWKYKQWVVTPGKQTTTTIGRMLPSLISPPLNFAVRCCLLCGF